MIETRWVKALVVLTFGCLSLLILVKASQRRRHIAYVTAGGCALVAAYVFFRVKIPEPQPSPPPGSAIGDVDSFLASASSLAEEFRTWASTKGLPATDPPAELREWIWEHRDDIGDDWDRLFRPAVAAYGESLRRSNHRAVWTKRKGDVVVEVPGRPWTRTWVANEIYDTLYADL